MTSKLIGREKECTELKRCYDADRSEFVIVYGRRRVGKTFLVDQYFSGVYDFSFVGGHKLPKQRQLRNFAKALKKYSKAEKEQKFADWFEAFDALEEYWESLSWDRKKVVCIDEMPWIDSVKSDFVDALENFWNSWAARRNDILFIASGSATSWMVDKLIENQGGLHARITSSIYLRPFNLRETEQYLLSKHCKWDRYQILQCYMILGGIPFYLSLLEVNNSLVQNIDKLFFQRNGVMQIEFEELYNALFTNADQYISVVKLLTEHRNGMTRKELSGGLKLEGGKLTRILNNLERCDFITKNQFYGHKTKDSIYQLVDFYTLFYYKFIENNVTKDEQWWSHNFESRSVDTWQGLSFELLCKLHPEQIKKALGISGMSCNLSTWKVVANNTLSVPGSQIDLIIDRADRMTHLCEIKFSKGPYRITNEYELKLRERMEVFRELTKSTKSLVHTFITTYGIADGKHSSVVHSEITMDDLFS